MATMRIRETRELVRTETVKEERDGKPVTVRRSVYRVRRPAHAAERVEKRRQIPFFGGVTEADQTVVEVGDPIRIEYVASAGAKAEISSAVANEIASFLDAAARKQRAIDLGINPESGAKYQVRTGAGEEPPTEMPPTDSRGRFHSSDGYSLKFSNLGVRMSRQDLRDYLEEKYGKGAVASINIRTDVDGNSRGFGFVTFETRDLAERCIAECDGKAIDHFALRIEWSQPSGQRV
eukprot:TRINITY_DN47619_c0_g1_i1.p2 TRINITY_DN47619_c0_g1~~TRINITY_DN47619_c0_g1_i1.p2  ORF type:complete len:235 (-),score=49.66 TRINITY_DN47619_c0_g1_i1:210-914(-)